MVWLLEGPLPILYIVLTDFIVGSFVGLFLGLQILRFAQDDSEGLRMTARGSGCLWFHLEQKGRKVNKEFSFYGHICCLFIRKTDLGYEIYSFDDNDFSAARNVGSADRRKGSGTFNGTAS
jgi:hypothetical protein